MFTIEIGGNPVAGNALMRAPAMPDPRSFAVIIVVANVMLTAWHLYVRGHLDSPMTPIGVGLFGVAINVVPLFAAALIWLRFKSGAWMLAAFFGMVAIIGAYEHFLRAGLDNVFTMADGPWTWSFRVTATLLFALDVLAFCFGLAVGARTASRPTT